MTAVFKYAKVFNWNLYNLVNFRLWTLTQSTHHDHKSLNKERMNLGGTGSIGGICSVHRIDSIGEYSMKSKTNHFCN